MATLGYHSLVDNLPPTLWDLKEIQKVKMADGRTFDQVVADIEAGFSLLNRDLLADPLIAGMYAVQNSVEVKYSVGDANGFNELTEFSRPDPGRGKRTGHSLPFNRRGRGLGWTWMGLMESSQDDLDVDIRSAVMDGRNDFPRRLVQRFFKMEAEDLPNTTGASVPLADGGTADSTYVPPNSPDGKTFASTHNHFKRQAAIDMTNINANIEDLYEHGHEAPYDILASYSDEATWTALQKWKAPTFTDLNLVSSTTERANLTDISRYNGYVETNKGLARVKFTHRIPTNYYGLHKSYGTLDPRNPLRLRIWDIYGWGYRLIPGQWANMPELLAVVAFFYGVGIGQDRTNGLCVFVNGVGNYVTPTIL